MQADKPRIIAVIPARGGSKGIPRKNMRLMHGKPLIEYAIENALNCSLIDDVAVSSDSQEILDFAQQFSRVSCLDRDSQFAQDAVTLDPVVYDAVIQQEKKVDAKYDIVITLQPTSPLLTVQTLELALKEFMVSKMDSMISVVNAPHLSWKNNNGKVVPAYAERKNRQEMPANYLETGAFLISKRECVTEDSRIGEKLVVFEVPEWESIDIDRKQDWVVCESLLSRKLIVFRADGFRELGMGHVFRALTLAYEFIEHDVVFMCDSRHQEGIDKLRSENMFVVKINNDQEMFAWMEANHPDVFVNDCLDTEISFIEKIKLYAKRVITFEDLGQGARNADAVINAVYEGASPHSNIYTGKDYACLRDEFLIAKPSGFSEEVRQAFVMFGGTDPLNLTARIYDLAKTYNRTQKKIEFDFILGPGYRDDTVVSIPELGIMVNKGVIRVSNHMNKADIALSSQGRTTFELACMGVPTIVLAQNEREKLHTFAQMDNGFINLGLGSEVSDEDIAATFEWLVKAKSVRREMRRLMLENDLKSGIKRVRRIILGELP
jgi:CMP-N-acetylneuraminic acid synthetase/spore coat polysaccharide biosynthesis predicted glycosyltransferase SpsG